MSLSIASNPKQRDLDVLVGKMLVSIRANATHLRLEHVYLDLQDVSKEYVNVIIMIKKK